ncbi:MAG: hypothetical protein II193_00055 [Lachnospiraceae bacterium]|nr:hypothetical protein [Lachnospiraceae bacterium]
MKFFMRCKKRKIYFKAGMTVEAAFVLPFFMFAILNMIWIIEIYRFQGDISAAMHCTAKEMAIGAYEYSEVRGGDISFAESLGLTCLFAANRVNGILGSEYLNKSPVKGGSKGISFIRSRVMDKDDCIDLVASYKVSAAVDIMNYNDLKMFNRIRTRGWTGYQNEGACGDEVTEEEIVYITPTGTVYHRQRSCTYISNRISAIDKSGIKSIRNKDGSIYYACESCGSKCTNVVFVSPYGNRYHSTINCDKLKRNVIAVPISEVGERTPCSKCG